MGDDLTRKCAYCGKGNLAGALTCEQCGKSLDGEAPRSGAEKDSVSDASVQGFTLVPDAPDAEGDEGGGHLSGGRYRLEEPLGSGGFGQVWKAFDTELSIYVAVKIVSAVALSDPNSVSALKREAQAASKLSHPNIVTVRSYEIEKDSCFLVMDYVEGPDLAQILVDRQEGKLAEGEVVDVGLQVCAALEHAHSKGVVHGDIKPANILKDPDWIYRLGDFGLAHLVRASRSQIAETTTGGTILYSSPETIRGEPIHERSDIYSLGATLYELASGLPPFTQGDIAYQHVHVPARRPEGVSGELWGILEGCLAKEAEDRPVDAREVGRLLASTGRKSGEEAGGGSVRAAGPVAQSRRGLRLRRYAPVLVLLGCLVVASGWLWYQRGRGGSRTEAGQEEPTNGSLARAAEMMDRGDPAAAEEGYKAFLSQDPMNDRALYAMGYALLLQGKSSEAESVFTRVEDASLRNEGLGAARHGRQGQGARLDLETVAQTAGRPYPHVLLASLDVGAEQYETAVERLRGLDSGQLDFGWQWMEYHRVLGQAHFHLEQYAKAQDCFYELSQSSSPTDVWMAGAYAGLVEEEQLKRSAIGRARLSEIQRPMESEDLEPRDTEGWKSRALRFYMPPPDVGTSRFARALGWSDVLPWAVEKTLAKESRLTPTLVDWDHLALRTLEDPLGALRDRFTHSLRAKMLVRCKFDYFPPNDVLTIEILFPQGKKKAISENFELPRDVEPEALTERVKSIALRAVAEEYPIRGRLLRVDGKAEIDIGSSVGVRKGMQFGVCSEADTQSVVNGHCVTVSDVVGGNSAEVSTEGFSVADIPDAGWYVTSEVSIGGE